MLRYFIPNATVEVLFILLVRKGVRITYKIRNILKGVRNTVILIYIVAKTRFIED